MWQQINYRRHSIGNQCLPILGLSSKLLRVHSVVYSSSYYSHLVTIIITSRERKRNGRFEWRRGRTFRVGRQPIRRSPTPLGPLSLSSSLVCMHSCLLQSIDYVSWSRFSHRCPLLLAGSGDLFLYILCCVPCARTCVCALALHWRRYAALQGRFAIQLWSKGLNRARDIMHSSLLIFGVFFLLL